MRVTLTLAPLRTTSNRDLANVIPGFGFLSSRHGYPPQEVRPVVLAVLAVVFAAPTNAHAAPKLSAQLATPSVRYGSAHKLEGKLVDGTTPLAGQEVVLEGRRYPYEGSYRVIERATTENDGSFDFKAKLDRNHRLRVSAPAQGVTTKYVMAYTLPSVELAFRAVSPGVVRLYQRYTVPKTVRLSAPTLFYLGKKGAKKASVRRTGELKRVRAGKYTSQATVRLPSSWGGEFRFASCFRASTGSGMGDPRQSCPHLKYSF
jgi:hypothetical protein